MKKLFLILGLVISILSLILPETSYAQPKAFMSETIWDFGNLPQGSIVSHSYWIKNTGTDTLKIIRVRPG